MFFILVNLVKDKDKDREKDKYKDRCFSNYFKVTVRNADQQLSIALLGFFCIFHNPHRPADFEDQCVQGSDVTYLHLREYESLNGNHPDFF